MHGIHEEWRRAAWQSGGMKEGRMAFGENGGGLQVIRGERMSAAWRLARTEEEGHMAFGDRGGMPHGFGESRDGPYAVWGERRWAVCRLGRVEMGRITFGESGGGPHGVRGERWRATWHSGRKQWNAAWIWRAQRRAMWRSDKDEDGQIECILGSRYNTQECKQRIEVK